MTASSSFRSLQKLLVAIPGLAPLAETVRNTASHSDRIAEFLGRPLNEHITLSKVTAESVVLIADSPVWATRVHFLTTALQDHLQAADPQASHPKVTVITRPDSALPATIPQAARRPVNIPADLLRDVAATLDNEPLRKTLLRMSEGGTTMDDELELKDRV